MLNSVGQLAQLNDHGVLIEYQLPLSSKRLDAMITGLSSEDQSSAVIVELKQWEKCQHADGANQVVTYVGGRLREVNHPSAQVGNYVEYLQDTHSAFHGDAALNLNGCGFLHNYKVTPGDVLIDEKFKQLVSLYPVFGNNDFEVLAMFLNERVGRGDGMSILDRVSHSTYRPSKKLMMHVASTIAGNKSYVLLDEQRVVFDKVLALVDKVLTNSRKQIVLVKGGPGTGKSVIALNLIAELSRNEKSTHYATGSRSFTLTLREIVGTRAGAQFKYFNSYMNAPVNSIDVLVCDEAHRIRATSNNQYTKKELRSNLPQIAELVHVSRVLVLFIDDYQVVKPGEVGSLQYVRDYVASRKDIDLHEYELVTQFRCGGSESFIEWVNNTLGIMDTQTPMLEKSNDYDFRVCESPEELEELISTRLEEGFTARTMAGFCWPWSNPNADGTLVNDVKVGEWERPWNAREDAGRLAKGIPKASLWAYSEDGGKQVG